LRPKSLYRSAVPDFSSERFRSQLLLFAAKHGRKVPNVLTDFAAGGPLPHFLSRQYRDAMVARAVKMLRSSSWTIADELFAQVLVDTLLKILAGREIENAEAYVFKSLKNQVVRYRMEQRRNDELFKPLIHDVASPPPSPRELDSDSSARLHRAVDELEPENRMVIHRSFFEGESLQTIAAATKQTKSAVHRIKHRALEELRQKVSLPESWSD
jgi:RNA polymerase sigma factor (sigma-70 family)